MGKYKIGDKVRIVGDGNSVTGKKEYVGKMFTVANIVTDRSRGYEYRLCDSSGYTGYIWRDSELELVTPTKPVKPEKIVITHDGKTTTATLYRPDGTKKVATARCAPGDTFDFNVGAKLAMERLTEPEAPKLYNGKVVCVKSGIKGVTVGKVYTFVDGMCKSDRGNEMVNAPVKSVEELNCCFCSVEFIEIVE